MYIVPHGCASNGVHYTLKLHIFTSNQIRIHRYYKCIHRTKYTYVEIAYMNGTVQLNRNAFVHIEIIRLYFELFPCVRRAGLKY